MRTTASDVALHGRHLNEVAASTVGEFTAAVSNIMVDKILLAAGTYELTSDMCTGSLNATVCISRTLIIEAEVPGAVVLNAMGARRVFDIQSGGTAELIGLNITGGIATTVQSARHLNPLRHFLHCPAENVLAFVLQGGGLRASGTATLTHSNFYSNTGSPVRARLCITFHRPLELTLELTGCCAAAHYFALLRVIER